MRAALFGLAVLVGCDSGPVLDLELDQSAASAADLDELIARVETLEQAQAEQAAELDRAEGELAECLSIAETAEANAAAAQERSAELRAELDDGELWDRLLAVEQNLGTLWTAVEALYE